MEGYDPSLFFDEDGKAYFTACRPHPDAEIIQCEIDIVTGARLSEVKTIWNGTGGAYPEGPHQYRIDGKVYLVIAEGGDRRTAIWSQWREATIPGDRMRAVRITPFSPIAANSRLSMQRDTRILCRRMTAAGGPYFWQRGRFRILTGRICGRETFLAQVGWSEDGWPLIGDKGKVSLEMEGATLPQVPLQPSGDTG